MERLGLYQTPNRLYDPVLGRFWGMDKLSDMYTSISPMAFGFNNPLQFMDPTGLSGDCDGCPEFTMPIFTVSSLGHRNNMVQLEAYYHAMRQSRNPVYRNLGLTAYREGLRAARDLSQRGRKLHFSTSEAQASRNSRYLDGIGKMVSYGITGSMVAAAASPVLVRGLVDGIGAKAVQRMAMETGLQMGTSLIFNGNTVSADIADIGLAGLFGKSAFFLQAFVDINKKDGFSSSIGIGNQKRISETVVDFSVGGFNFGYNKLLTNSEINSKVVSIISEINGTARILTGKLITTEY
ncbi:MAG: RHS repeat-associated core domain-containing protein [Cyclobacteriaceae bacterium]